MTQEELIADTNRLLTRFLEIDDQQRAETDKMLKESEEKQKEWDKNLNEDIRERLRKMGVAEELLEGDHVDWEKRSQEVMALSKKRVEEAKEREVRYKEEVLNELRTQTELLNRIAEKLGL